ncbi:MAG: hypothetical protein DCC55_02220 [Chloroflexi bacterium]|nr:MAG: hypothetical protein DCC55_02220 [Chloroflexota bacterium]
MQKLDLKKQLKHLYAPSARTVEIVQVPRLQFAMIDGKIEPGHRPGDSPRFQAATAVLFGIAYTLKFMSKQQAENPIDYGVMPLEALWWIEEGEFDFDRPDNWHFTAMIMQPEHITGALFAEALARQRKKADAPILHDLRFASFEEGLCVQTLHIGPYATEPATVARMEAFARDQGYLFHRKHHEIYLSDPRRTAPEKLKTILRHPVERSEPVG